VAARQEQTRHGPQTRRFAARDEDRHGTVLVTWFLEDLLRRHNAGFSGTMRPSPLSPAT
jgi:hypothetical protein